MGRKPILYLISGILATLLQSCFEEDQPVPPYVPPANVETASLSRSMYTHQSYFSLEGIQVSASNENESWELAFDADTSGFHIRLNSAGLWGIARTGSTLFDASYDHSDDLVWLSDKSDGNPDSTAVGSWVQFSGKDTAYSREVMLLGQFDGIKYHPWKKLQFIQVNKHAYRLVVAGPEQASGDTLEVLKDDRFRYIQFSLTTGAIEQSEPEKEDWDLLFTQYHTILYTDEGQPTPYYVRGVLSQMERVEVSLDSTVEFRQIDLDLARQYTYSGKADALGYDWKGVTIDEATNSAEYRVRPGHTYLIRVNGKIYYKLRFTSFFNKEGLRGYPSFEYVLLEP